MMTENKLLCLPKVFERIPIEEFSQIFDNGLKKIYDLDDFNQIVDWETSSFYKASNYSSIAMN